MDIPLFRLRNFNGILVYNVKAMNKELIAFAVKTENAHIAVVASDHNTRDMHFRTAQDQLHAIIERVYLSERKIHLVNGTFIHFVSASHFERMRGLQLDRIQTTLRAIYEMPEFFLESRLAPGVTPEEGIVLSNGK